MIWVRFSSLLLAFHKIIQKMYTSKKYQQNPGQINTNRRVSKLNPDSIRSNDVFKETLIKEEQIIMTSSRSRKKLNSLYRGEELARAQILTGIVDKIKEAKRPKQTQSKEPIENIKNNIEELQSLIKLATQPNHQQEQRSTKNRDFKSPDRQIDEFYDQVNEQRNQIQRKSRARSLKNSNNPEQFKYQRDQLYVYKHGRDFSNQRKYKYQERDSELDYNFNAELGCQSKNSQLTDSKPRSEKIGLQVQRNRYYPSHIYTTSTDSLKKATNEKNIYRKVQSRPPLYRKKCDKCGRDCGCIRYH